MNNSAGRREIAKMPPEYNFTNRKGVRGKYCQAYRQGHTVKICHKDGTVSVKYVTSV